MAAMHPLTRSVVLLANALEMSQFRNPAEFERILEIRQLAYEQMRDDQDETGFDHRQSDKRGSWVLTGDDIVIQGETLWKKWSPEYVALEAGMAVFISKLTNWQKECIHLVYWTGLNPTETAAALGVRRQSVNDAVKTAIRELKKMLMAQFINEKEE